MGFHTVSLLFHSLYFCTALEPVAMATVSKQPHNRNRTLQWAAVIHSPRTTPVPFTRYCKNTLSKMVWGWR